MVAPTFFNSAFCILHSALFCTLHLKQNRAIRESPLRHLKLFMRSVGEGPTFAKGKLAKFALRTLFSAGEAEQRGGRYFQ